MAGRWKTLDIVVLSLLVAIVVLALLFLFLAIFAKYPTPEYNDEYYTVTVDSSKSQSYTSVTFIVKLKYKGSVELTHVQTLNSISTEAARVVEAYPNQDSSYVGQQLANSLFDMTDVKGVSVEATSSNDTSISTVYTKGFAILPISD